MTRKDFIDRVAEDAGLGLSKKDTEAVVDAAFAIIGDSVGKEQRFAYPGFGTFSLRQRPARDGRNPHTGARLKIKASKTIAFKPAPTLRQGL